MPVRVPFFEMAKEVAALRSEIDVAIARVLDGGVFVGGEEVSGFERELAAATSTRCAIGVSSGTDALLAIGMALGIGTGDEVVTTPFTFFATAGAFARLGARVVFADVDDATLNLDPARALAACTPRTRAIVVVHLFGRPAAIPDAACAIVEDAAHTGVATRPRGVAAALSFYPTKILGALGDAGAVITDDATLGDRIAVLRTQGARPKYHHVALGGNFRLDAIQAAVLRVKLRHVAAWTAARRRIADTYRAAFAARSLDVRVPDDHAEHAYHQWVIRTPRRDALRAHLAGAGIATEIYYPEPLHLQPCFADLGYRSGSLPIAERACRDVLALPIQPALSDDVPAQIVDEIARFFS
jgi:dTDP-4-amino-4,6-dideoxygalactose transaminase